VIFKKKLWSSWEENLLVAFSDALHCALHHNRLVLKRCFWLVFIPLITTVPRRDQLNHFFCKFQGIFTSFFY